MIAILKLTTEKTLKCLRECPNMLGIIYSKHRQNLKVTGLTVVEIRVVSYDFWVAKKVSD